MILTIAAAVFVFGLLVLVHEFGHFITAKMTGMRVDEFAIGFGPKLISRKHGETVYSLRAIPLGGFNDIAGMDPDNNTAGERGFCAKPVLSRMVVILAGATMNFILPIILFFTIYATLGVGKPADDPIIGGIIPGMAAEQVGLKEGDKILSVDGQTVTTWKDFTDKLKSVEAGQNVQLRYERAEKISEVTVAPTFNEQEKRVLLGVQSSIVYESKTLPESLSLALEHTKDITVFMLESIVQLFKEPEQTENLAGPIGIVQMSGQVAERGFIPLLNFAALLSINLGIINLLPVPVLDGGHFVNLFIEAVRGKPLGAKAVAYTQRVGIALLLMLMLFATKNDLVRVFMK
ncbi:MAG: RIP metalloprotease RseP [Selenomonadaceae bacterium]|nr:RIP metalloprotease RseP [Selenomonadaceae bacterium]